MHGSLQEVPRRASILTPLALSRLLEWLDEGADSNGERYLEMHRRLVAYFDRRNRLAATELADETLRRIAGTLEQAGAIETRPAARYCYLIAKFVLLEDLRRERRQVRFNETSPAMTVRPERAAPPDGNPSTTEERLNRLDRCLEQLRAEERALIVEYYGDSQRRGTNHRHRMAERLGISRNALSIRAFRIRETLMNCVTSCSQEPR